MYSALKSVYWMISFHLSETERYEKTKRAKLQNWPVHEKQCCCFYVYNASENNTQKTSWILHVHAYIDDCMCLGSLCLCIRMFWLCCQSNKHYNLTAALLCGQTVSKWNKTNVFFSSVTRNENTAVLGVVYVHRYLVINAACFQVPVAQNPHHSTPCILSDTTHRLHPEEQELLQMIRWSRMQDNSGNSSQKCENTPSETSHDILFICDLLVSRYCMACVPPLFQLICQLWESGFREQICWMNIDLIELLLCKVWRL